MQALGQTLCPCYAAEDAELVTRVTAFLERGADVRVFLEEGAMQAGADLAAKAREARIADRVLVFFSRHALPSRWPRAQWEDALVKEPAAEGVPIAFVRCDDCVPPGVLRPAFAAHQLREIKRWVRGAEPGSAAAPEFAADLDILGLAIADRPGVEAVGSIAMAREFVRVFRPDFDGVFHLEVADRSLAALAGDLASQLGLRLEGELDQNLERLRAFCEPRRLLLVHEGAPVSELKFGGRCSTLVSTQPGQASTDPLCELQRAFRGVAASWALQCQSARQARRVAHEHGRIAELHELMQRWLEMAEERDDSSAQNDASRELVWILEAWGRTEEAQRLEYRRAATLDQQMLLFSDFS